MHGFPVCLPAAKEFTKSLVHPPGVTLLSRSTAVARFQPWAVTLRLSYSTVCPWISAASPDVVIRLYARCTPDEFTHLATNSCPVARGQDDPTIDYPSIPGPDGKLSHTTSEGPPLALVRYDLRFQRASPCHIRR